MVEAQTIGDTTNQPDGRIVGFFHGGISVADLDRSLTFYQGELGRIHR